MAEVAGETVDTETGTALAEDHSHEDGHDHDHEGHAHQHGPSLNPELTREIEVEAPAEEVSKAYRTVVKRYQKLARIPGFRAGKVPESLVRSKFARELRQEVMETLVSERFREAIRERKLNPVSEPQLLDLMLVDGQPMRFKAAFEVLPEFDVSGYESVKVRSRIPIWATRSSRRSWPMCWIAMPRSSQWKRTARWSTGIGRRSSFAG